MGDHNYCRNPDGSDTVWCYTTTPGLLYEDCDINKFENDTDYGRSWEGRIANNAITGTYPGSQSARKGIGQTWSAKWPKHYIVKSIFIDNMKSDVENAGDGKALAGVEVYVDDRLCGTIPAPTVAD